MRSLNYYLESKWSLTWKNESEVNEDAAFLMLVVEKSSL